MSVPKLRFSEFSGDWENGVISDYGHFYYGKSAPKWSVTADATTPCVRYGELYTTHNEIVKTIKSYTNIPVGNLKFSKGGEVLVPRVGEKPLDFSLCTYLPFKDIAIGEMISVYNTTQNPLFIVYYFRGKMKYEFAKKVEGGNVSNLYFYYLEDINTKIPTLLEQEKIADFLSTFDEKIENQQGIVNSLETQKKGFMQKIFSKELRFKGENGGEFGDWEEKKLGELFSFIRNGFVGTVTNYYTNQEDGIRYIQGTNIHNGIISDNICYYITKEFHNKHIKNELKKDDILLVQSGHVGENAVVGEKYKGSNCHALIIMSNGGNCSSEYVSMYLSSEIGMRAILYTSTGNTIKHILSSEMKNIEITIPTLPEQEKIAAFLSTLDEKINVEKQILDKLKLAKKGLLQQMFC